MSDDAANDTSMSVQQIQSAVHAWVSQWEEGYWGPLSNLARLTEEVGELARAVNHRYGEKPARPGDEETEDIAEELGDILFVVVAIANSLDIDLDEAFRGVLEKYDIRDADRFTPLET